MSIWVLYCSGNVFSQTGSKGLVLLADGPTTAPGGGLSAKDVISQIDNVGAAAILVILIWKVPELVRINNEGKKELAAMLIEAQLKQTEKFEIMLTARDEAWKSRYESQERTVKELVSSVIDTGKNVTNLTFKIDTLERTQSEALNRRRWPDDPKPTQSG